MKALIGKEKKQSGGRREDVLGFGGTSTKNCHCGSWGEVGRKCRKGDVGVTVQFNNIQSINNY